MSRPAVFLDRDGTIIVEKVYLSDPAGVELIPGAVEGLHRFRRAGFLLVVVTNQAGIARGRYTIDDYRAVEDRLSEMLGEHGVSLDATYFCPHHPDWTGPCDCRKPASGMHMRAAEVLEIDLARSVFIGDKVSDVEPGLAFGGQGILVRTGHGRAFEADVPAGVRIVDDLRAASRAIVDRVDSGEKPRIGS